MVAAINAAESANAGRNGDGASTGGLMTTERRSTGPSLT